MQAACITANPWPTRPSNAIASVKQDVRPIERRCARPIDERSETSVCSRKRFVKHVQTTRIITLEAVRVCVFEAGDDNGGRVGLVVRALAFHQCGPGSISLLGVICGLSLLVLYSALRGFSSGTPVFPSHLQPTFDLISSRTVKRV